MEIKVDEENRNSDTTTSVGDVGNGFQQASQKACQRILVMIGCGMQLEGQIHDSSIPELFRLMSK